MSPSNHHQYKRGSATNGTRYKYRKGQVEWTVSNVMAIHLL
jgi:hypothetical protein